MNDLHLFIVPVTNQCVCESPHPVSQFTQHKAELDGLLFDMGVRLCDVGAAAAERVCQN